MFSIYILAHIIIQNFADFILWIVFTKYFVNYQLNSLLTFWVKYKQSALANQDVTDYQSSLVKIFCIRISNKTIQRRPSMTSNLEDFEYGNVLSKYQSVINFLVELVSPHGASRRNEDK